jgi:hypothetical protein
MRERRSIGKKKALAIYKSGLWKKKPARDVALLQLTTVQLCMPFDEFHRITEEALGRPVWTHEFANGDALMAELLGEAPRPTIEEIFALLPAEKTIVIIKETPIP